MTFPTSPTNGQTATVSGVTYQYNSTSSKWSRVGAAASTGAQGNQGFQGSGNQGFQGFQGSGNQGFQGFQGSGNQGYQGYQGAGNQGFQGSQGSSASSGLVKISSTGFDSVSAVSVTSGISSSYSYYKLFLNIWSTNGYGLTQPKLQWYTNNGVDTSAAYGGTISYSNGSNSNLGLTTSVSGAAGYSGNNQIFLGRPDGGIAGQLAYQLFVNMEFKYDVSNNIITHTMIGQWNGGSQIFFTAGEYNPTPLGTPYPVTGFYISGFGNGSPGYGLYASGTCALYGYN